MQIENYNKYFYQLFKDWGWNDVLAAYANLFVNILILFIITALFNFFLRKFLKRFIIKLTAKSKTKLDNFLVKNKTLSYFSLFLTLIIIRWAAPITMTDFTAYQSGITTLLNIINIIVIIFLVRAILRGFKDYLKTKDNYKDKPIDSYIQVFMIFTWMMGLVLIFSIFTGKSIWYFVTGLGAFSAVVLLIFKDSILGFVASIQVAANDMVRIGDWITMEKYGADGDVIEINLSSVKVRNFDNTITTIPTYYLISDSFKNWRGMINSGGRRIKRALLIKASSIRFLEKEEVKKLESISLIREYLTHRQEDIDKYNQDQNIDKSVLMNGRNQTNFGVFRKYIDSYLNQHSAINKDMVIMTRQLAPTEKGIPLEIYAFSKDKVWQNYEYIIADIFDHLLASLKYFELEIFELPSGQQFDIHMTNKNKGLNENQNTEKYRK
ncbi:mechanosensitive ion channel family protein [Mesonia sp. K7]|uniref:mechanosensitive ion channel family protein n=1 Tax=Mesonia sp. K7 TaxID=2218606 RepID=UPI000DA7C7A2|nr:mechanosensitive ion channel domain-containing protein [Mesonia sp. K7]PZD79315.1 mechanosensitive ion channel family protein [Mesonia sp. K7]